MSARRARRPRGAAAAGVLVLALALAGARSPQDPVDATRAVLRRAGAQAIREPRAAIAPREAYLLPPPVTQVRLSPDGRHVSYVQRREGGEDLMLLALATGTTRRAAPGVGRATTTWSGDGRHLWLADAQGLAVVPATGGAARRVRRWQARHAERLWEVDARAPAFAVVRETIVDAGRVTHRYLRVDTAGTTRTLFEGASPLRGLLLDADGEPAYTAWVDGPRFETVIRRHAPGGSRTLLRCGALDDCRLVGFSRREGTLWVLASQGGDRTVLRRWTERGGRWETVHGDPRGIADTDGVLWSPAREDWLAVAYHGDRRRWHGGDAETRGVLAALERHLPGANLRLSATNDRGLWLVTAQQARLAWDRYYLYDPAGDCLRPLFAGTVPAGPLPPPGVDMHPVTYRASDGMLLHGYVLLPGGVAPDRAPLIAWVHGGPIAREYDTFDPQLQLLVNRGAAVFVPNFRASTGYGRGYVLAADGDVGDGRVLADILDGLDFLLAEGIGDRERQGVMGMSFGGYASLLAASHHPARFRVAFAGIPPTEYGWIKEWQADHDPDPTHADAPPLSVQFTQLGFRYTDAAWRERMRRESPLAMLPALRTPVYLWAGARDDRVPLRSVVHYASEARRLGKAVTLMIDPGAGHGPAGPTSAEALLYLMELALHRHLGAPLPALAPDLRTVVERQMRVDIDPGRPVPLRRRA